MLLEGLIAAGTGLVIAGLAGKVLMSKSDQRRLDDTVSGRQEIDITVRDCVFFGTA